MDAQERTLNCLLASCNTFRQLGDVQAVAIFLTVARHPGIAMRDLVAAVQPMPRSTVSRLVTRLAGAGAKGRGRGWVTYGDTPEDRRARTVRLTKRGRDLVDELVRVYHAC